MKAHGKQRIQLAGGHFVGLSAMCDTRWTLGDENKQLRHIMEHYLKSIFLSTSKFIAALILFFQHNIFIGYLGISKNTPTSYLPLSLPKRRKQTNKQIQNQVHVVVPCTQWSTVKHLVASPKRKLSPSPLVSLSEPSVVENYISASLLNCLRVLFDSFLSRLYPSWRGKVWEGAG